MESRLLEYMLRVAELGSINKAATDLQMSQPALSRHILALEEEMGTKLFHRTQGGVVCTEAGQLLVERARPLLQQLSMLKEELGDAASGQLTIGVPPCWRRVLTSPLVQTLVATYPDIQLRVNERMTHVRREHLLAGLLDLCVMPFEADTPPGFEQTALVRERLVVLGSPALGLRQDEATALSWFEGAKLILPPRANVLRSQLEHMLHRNGVSFQVGVEPDSLGQCLRFAQQGAGVTVVPCCALTALGEYGLSPAVVSVSPIRGLYMTWSLFENTARGHSRAAREGKRVLTQTLRRTVDAGFWEGLEVISPLTLST